MRIEFGKMKSVYFEFVFVELMWGWKKMQQTRGPYIADELGHSNLISLVTRE